MRFLCSCNILKDGLLQFDAASIMDAMMALMLGPSWAHGGEEDTV
jgi:hypothetical protein